MEKRNALVIVGGSRTVAGKKVEKGVSNYMAGAIHEFANGAEQVMLRARGKAISLAVDVAQKLGRLPGYAADPNIVMGTEQVGSKGDNVSFVEILVRRKEG